MKTANELTYLADKRGWEVGPLTYGEIQRMGSDEALFHERFNKAEYERALNEPREKENAKKAAAEIEQVKTENAKIKEAWDGKKFWEQNITPEGFDVRDEAFKFQHIYPQFVVNQKNSDAITDWLDANNCVATTENMSKAFQALAREGRLILNPSACGIIRIRMGDGKELDIKSEDLPNYQRRNPPTIEGRGLWRKTVQKPIEILPAVESITGSQLANHSLFDVLADAYDSIADAERYQDSLSADEYRNQHPEAWRDPRAYADAAEKTKREINAFFSFHPEYVSTPENRQHLDAYLKKRKLDFNRQNLEVAYGELFREGYIETNPEAVVKSNGTKLVDYGNKSPEPQDYSKLRADISRMNSAQYAEYLRDPTNRKMAEEAYTASR